MKNAVIVFFLLSISICGFAQDKIYLSDNSIVNAKIIEVGVAEVKYKKADNLTGPDYVMPKSMIALIIFENGTHEVINGVKNTVTQGDVVIDILPYYKTGKNYIALNYFDLIYQNVTLTYQRFLCGQNFGINLSASAGFNKGNYNGGFLNFDQDVFHSMLSFNYFPTGVNKVSYFTGVSLMSGYGKQSHYDYWYNPGTLEGKYYYGFYVNNGVLFSLTKHFNMRTSLNLGLVDRDMNGDFQTHGIFEISAGIRF